MLQEPLTQPVLTDKYTAFNNSGQHAGSREGHMLHPGEQEWHPAQPSCMAGKPCHSQHSPTTTAGMLVPGRDIACTPGSRVALPLALLPAKLAALDVETRRSAERPGASIVCRNGSPGCCQSCS